MKKFPKEAHVKWVEKIGQSWVDRAKADYNYQDIPKTKLFYLTKPRAAALFGIHADPYSAVTVTQRNETLHPQVLASSAMGDGNEERTPYGFFRSDRPPVDLPARMPRVEEVVKWQHAGRDRAVVVRADRKQDYAKLIPTELKHKELWRKGRFTQLFVLGANVKPDEHDEEFPEVMDYYGGEDFRFGPPEPIRDSEEMIRKLLESGELRLLIKNAHAGGDTESLMSIFNRGKLHRGVKEHPDGRVETVLVFEGDRSSGISQLRNDRLGDWMRNRPPEEQGQLAFINNICWAHDAFVTALPSINSRHLYPVGAVTTVYGFYNSRENALMNVIDGIRHQQTPEQIRDRLQANVEGYRKLTAQDIARLRNSSDLQRYGAIDRGDDQVIMPDEKQAFDYFVGDRMRQSDKRIIDIVPIEVARQGKGNH